MSFGFSVGDFLAVIGLVTQLRKDFVDAPSQLRDLSAELKTFSILLQDTEVDLTANDLDSRQHEALEDTLSSAREFLEDLRKFIEKNKEIPTSTGSKVKVNLKRIWKRLNFDQHEVSKFRHQISVIISGLQMFASNEVKHNTRKIVRYVNEQEHKDILKWLSDDDYNYHKNYQSHLVRNRQAGTRRWLLCSDEWKSWLKSAGQTLYCPGIPGSGKTFTTAMVIENIGSMSEGHGWVFAYVFCNYQRHRENMCEILLRSLLRMVLEQTQEISDEIQRWPTRNKEISIDEMIEHLRLSIKGCSRVFFMVDALDELDVFQDLVSYLFDLQKAVGVNLYFTSRRIPHIRMLFDKTMIVPIKATEHDVGVYIEHQMKKPNVPSFVRSNQALQEEIKKTVVNAVGEMFLLAELQVTQLMQSKSTRRLQNALKAITSGISTYDTAYQAAMDRIQSQDKRLYELATNAISILAYAERPLLAPELVHALSVDLDIDESSDNEPYKTGDVQSMIDSLGVYDPDLMPTIEDVVAASAGLIVHQPDSGIVQLVHKTTKEYLMSEDGRRKWFPRAQLTIAAICLIYSQAFESRAGSADWPFLEYAQKHYGHHIMAQQTLERREGSASVPSPHESTPGSISSVSEAQSLIDQIGLARMAQDLGGVEGVLIAACEKNQLNFARVLLSTNQYSRPSGKSANIDTLSLYVEADSAIDRALLAAVRNGHVEIVDLLLKYGASHMVGRHVKHKGVMSLLAIAASEGHHDIITYFLDHGYFATVMMQHDEDGAGCVNEDLVGLRRPEVVAEFFLRTYTIDLSTCDGSGANALIQAAKEGVSKLVHLILEKRGDLLNSQDFRGRTALSWATTSARGSIDVVPILLGYKGIQPELADANGLTAIDYVLAQLTRFSYSSVHETLLLSMIPFLEHGINMIVRDGCTLLHMLIDASDYQSGTSWAGDGRHWGKPKRYEGRDIFELRKEWAQSRYNWVFSVEMESSLPRLSLHGFEEALRTASASAAQVRCSPCKCGIGTIFLAILTENVKVVELLLEFYPDLVNDRFFDGSSPLDLAMCIQDPNLRHSMSDRIISKILIANSDETDSPRSDIGESDSGDAQQDCSLTPLDLNQGKGIDQTTEEINDK
ncbi:hypothetical protein LA080_000991 [Diaporthe eres]|nr:hypothetical protein LA080_000991 [Diaporthe eres]